MSEEDLKRQTLIVMREVRLLADMLGIGERPLESPESPQSGDWALKVYQAYPKKIGRKKGLLRLEKIISSQDDFDLVMVALSHYKEYLSDNETPLQFTKQFDVWVNNWEDWIEPPQTQKRMDEEKKAQARRARQLQIQTERKQFEEEQKKSKENPVDFNAYKKELQKQGLKL